MGGNHSVLYRFPKVRAGGFLAAVKIGQKTIKKKYKIVHTFSVPHGIIITVKTPQYII